VRVPVLVSGGAGNWGHFAEALAPGGADAACTNNIYHFTETSMASAKAFLAAAGVPVRAS
jgi:imidazole glycerol-phosphate synthase subunit HisF